MPHTQHRGGEGRGKGGLLEGGRSCMCEGREGLFAREREGTCEGAARGLYFLEGFYLRRRVEASSVHARYEGHSGDMS